MSKYYKADDVDLVCIKNFANGDVLSAIRSLPTIEVSEDCISREELLKAFGLSEKSRKYGGDHSGYQTLMLYEIQDIIEDAPSVVPTTEQSSMVGEWENYKDEHRCSECGEVVIGDWYDDEWYDYCPNCGAKMKG